MRGCYHSIATMEQAGIGTGHDSRPLIAPDACERAQLAPARGPHRAHVRFQAAGMPVRVKGGKAIYGGQMVRLGVGR